MARAHALAVLALEEIGKVTLCLVAVLVDEPEIQQIRRELNDHKAKLEKAFSFAGLHAPSFEPHQIAVRIEQAIHTEAAQEMRGLYVDWVEDRLITPHDVEAQETDQLLGLQEVLVVAAQLDLTSPLLADPDVRRQWASQSSQLDALRLDLAALPPSERRARSAALLDSVDGFVKEYREQADPPGLDGN